MKKFMISVLLMFIAVIGMINIDTKSDQPPLQASDKNNQNSTEVTQEKKEPVIHINEEEVLSGFITKKSSESNFKEVDKTFSETPDTSFGVVDNSFEIAISEEDNFEIKIIDESSSPKIKSHSKKFSDIEIEEKIVNIVNFEKENKDRVLSEDQIDIVRFSYESVGAIPYYWGGRTNIKNFEDNNFGSIVKPDARGRTAKGLDCSGFVSYVYWVTTDNNLGQSGTISMRDYGSYYVFGGNDDDEIEVGDILWLGKYKNSNNVWSGHVGIYVGNGKVVEEVGSPTNNVVESEFDKDDWMGFIKISK